MSDARFDDGTWVAQWICALRIAHPRIGKDRAIKRAREAMYDPKISAKKNKEAQDDIEMLIDNLWDEYKQAVSLN